MRKITLVAALSLACIACQAEVVPSSEMEEPQHAWLTIGADALPIVEELFPNSALIQTHETEQGIAILHAERSVLSSLTTVMHERFNRCGGYRWHETYDEARGVLDVDFEAVAAAKSFNGYTIDNAAVAQRFIDEVDEARIVEVIGVMSGFTNRYYNTPSGVESARWLAELWRSYANGRPDVTVELYDHPFWPQDSVILTIPGGADASEVVVIGGHLDSTVGSTGPNTFAPGADDDASGIATLTEVIRIAMREGYKPSRTVKFMGYAAEEVGLRGSGDIADEHNDLNIDVIGVLQLDMTNYHGSSRDVYLINDYTNSAQNAFIGDLLDTYLPSLQWTYSTCGYGCSDHASWTANGFAASLPFESAMGAHNPNIHTGGDTISVSGSNAEHAIKFARLAGTYVAELAKGTFDDAIATDDPPTDPPFNP